MIAAAGLLSRRMPDITRSSGKGQSNFPLLLNGLVHLVGGGRGP